MRRPNTSEKGAQRRGPETNLNYICKTLKLNLPIAKPRTNKEIPKVTTSVEHLNS